MKDSFFKYQAQTTENPICLEISKANGSYIYDTNNKKYLDFVAGVSASNLGHNNKKIKKAVINQLNLYWHVMVYGEFVQKPTIKLCELISKNLPKTLNNTYLTNSGTEAIEGAMKLAKRITSKSKIISFNNSYHGSTHGALSIMGKELYKTKYRPPLPHCELIDYNSTEQLVLIDNLTAAVVVEPIQGATGFSVPSKKWLKALRQRCDEVGALLIFDEIQTGFGRTGQLFALDTFDVIPDILCIAKGMGGGMPIGCFISSKENMDKLKDNPKLGHITTFGGHPVCCAASLATLKTLLEEKEIIQSIK